MNEPRTRLEDITHEQRMAYLYARIAFGEAMLARGRALLALRPRIVIDFTIECPF